MGEELRKLWKTEDCWAGWLGAGIVALALIVFWARGGISSWAVAPGSWSGFGTLAEDFAEPIAGYVIVRIGVVSIWAVAMILLLTVVVKLVVPDTTSPGEAGAWVAEAIESGSIGNPSLNPDDPIDTFTVMKVIWGTSYLQLCSRKTGPTSAR